MRRTLPLAIVGLVALSGCASPSAAPDTAVPSPGVSAPGSPTDDAAAPTSTAGETAPPTGADGRDPEADAMPTTGPPYRIDDASILGAYSLDDVPSQRPLVAWANPERSLVHVIGVGSGSPDCQPTGESLALDDGALAIEFAPADPMVACTADLRVFGWAFPVAGADASVAQARVDGWSEGDDEVTVDIRPATSLE